MIMLLQSRLGRNLYQFRGNITFIIDKTCIIIIAGDNGVKL